MKTGARDDMYLRSRRSNAVDQSRHSEREPLLGSSFAVVSGSCCGAVVLGEEDIGFSMSGVGLSKSLVVTCASKETNALLRLRRRLERMERSHRGDCASKDELIRDMSPLPALISSGSGSVSSPTPGVLHKRFADSTATFHLA
jgi:hypothetical protein